tara:strand:- start:104 stop:799 length:696 start_codon:yes stop_codon:yes gene_type:complete
MDSKKILIVEDEFDILKLIEFNLKKEGFDVIAVSDGESAIKEVRSNKPDLILLDLMLPGISGLDVCHLIQKDEGLSQIPILMLTAKGEESDVVKGLEAGADDYVIKPFSVKVLLARIKALLRRDYGQEFDKKNKPLVFNRLSIHAGQRIVKVDDKIIDLTYMEFQILFTLASHSNWVYTRSQLIDEIRGDNYIVTDRSIDFQVVGLRKKLGEASKYIKTVRGVGYRFFIED